MLDKVACTRFTSEFRESPSAMHLYLRTLGRFMVLDPYQVGYFIEQVGLAAASFGVAQSDINAVASALESLFDYRCAPKTTVIEAQGPRFQSICTDEKCPLAMNSTCAAQPVFPQPLVANKTVTADEGEMSSMSASTSSVGATSTSTPIDDSDSDSSASSAASNAADQQKAELKSFISRFLALFAL